MRVSVIIPVWAVTHELRELTRQCLRSLKQTILDDNSMEIIIVDNGGIFGTDCLRDYPISTVITNKTNLGYPAGSNQGMRFATGDIFCIANNDTRPSPNWLRLTKEIFESNKKVGSLHFKMVDYDQEIILGKDVWLKGKVVYWSQSFFCLRREAIEEIGLMDENYGLGGQDDYDWHYRMNILHKWLSPYTNKAAYQHKDSSTQILIDSEVKEELYAKNTAYFKSKYGKTPNEMWEHLYPDMKNHSWKPFI